jgi:hypothetical protein
MNKAPANEIDSVQQAAALTENPADSNSVQQPVGLLEVLCKVPWGHHESIINKVKEN